MRSEDDKRRDRYNAGTVQDMAVVMEFKWGCLATHDARRIMVQNNEDQSGEIPMSLPCDLLLLGDSGSIIKRRRSADVLSGMLLLMAG